MIDLFHQLSQDCSRLTTERYSSSFSSAIKLLHMDMRAPVYNIYGFVRFADEIVDSFHGYDKTLLLAEFKKGVHDAVDRGISLNPVLHSFQITVHKSGIPMELIDAFLHSMEMDLDTTKYDKASYENYIYGSAEVVGLMCLCVFCEGDEERYEKLKPYARSLGAAFQKVNFLRDLKSDHESLDRMYFPGCDFNNFSVNEKLAIEAEIQQDFKHAFEGIVQLPVKVRFGIYVAYKYYLSLFRKIRKLPPQNIMEYRIRIPDYRKLLILANAGIRSQLNLL